MIQLRNFQLPTVVQSPMADCTDLPFRLIAREHGMRFAYMEMVSSEALVRNAKKTYKLMQTVFEDRPVGTQIVGSDAGVMAEAAAIVEGMGMDLLDMNLGCPVPKIVCNGAGSQLMREPEKTRKIFIKVVKAVKRIPVTVKMRLGYSDASGEEAAQIARIAEDCGVQAVAVHGRTRMQGYTGAADYVAIGHVKRAVSIPVYGNGDVVDAPSALRLRQVSGCDGVMLGRGALGNPWIYQQIQAALEGLPESAPPSFEQRKQVVLRHIALEEQYNPETHVGPLRRIVCWYFKDFPGAAQLRKRIHAAQRAQEMRTIVAEFDAADTFSQ